MRCVKNRAGSTTGSDIFTDYGTSMVGEAASFDSTLHIYASPPDLSNSGEFEAPGTSAQAVAPDPPKRRGGRRAAAAANAGGETPARAGRGNAVK